jgi:trans-2-enoyl-CoA reductase
MCVAFRLLHDFGSLKPGDGVILNAANSTVGTCIIQLCRCLKLRPIAVVRDPGNKADLDKLVSRLKSLGASEARACSGALAPVAPSPLTRRRC